MKCPNCGEEIATDSNSCKYCATKVRADVTPISTLLNKQKDASVKIIGIENMSYEDISREINKGGRFVRYSQTISVAVASFYRPCKEIYFLKYDEKPIKYGSKYLLLSVFLGWWGIPAGPIFTIKSIFDACKGIDVTNEVFGYIMAIRDMYNKSCNVRNVDSNSSVDTLNNSNIKSIKI